MATTCLTRTFFIISEILFLVLIHIRREVVSSMPWLYYPEGKNPHHPQNGWLDGPRNKSGCFANRKKKKRVALIMLIIALQFDVSTSKKKKRVALIMLIIALMN